MSKVDEIPKNIGFKEKNGIFFELFPLFDDPLIALCLFLQFFGSNAPSFHSQKGSLLRIFIYFLECLLHLFFLTSFTKDNQKESHLFLGVFLEKNFIFGILDFCIMQAGTSQASSDDFRYYIVTGVLI